MAGRGAFGVKCKIFNVELEIFSEQFTVLKVFDVDWLLATLELLLVIRGKTLVHGSEDAKSNSSRMWRWSCSMFCSIYILI